MIKDNPTSVGYWGDPSLSKKISTKGRALKQVLKLLKQLKEAKGGESSSTDDESLAFEVFITKDKAQEIPLNELPDVVTGIYNNAYTSYTGTDIIIPEHIKFICKNGFNPSSNTKKISIIGDITEIGELAFYSTKSLSNVTLIILPKQECVIQPGAFYCNYMGNPTYPYTTLIVNPNVKCNGLYEYSSDLRRSFNSSLNNDSSIEMIENLVILGNNEEEVANCLKDFKVHQICKKVLNKYTIYVADELANETKAGKYLSSTNMGITWKGLSEYPGELPTT